MELCHPDDHLTGVEKSVRTGLCDLVGVLLLGPELRRIGLAALVLALVVFVWRSLDAHFGWFIPFATSVDSKRIRAWTLSCGAALPQSSILTFISGCARCRLPETFGSPLPAFWPVY
jgi:hypothetical protein